MTRTKGLKSGTTDWNKGGKLAVKYLNKPKSVHKENISTSIVRRSKECTVEVDYDHVAPSEPRKVCVTLVIKAKGDFAHHLIEDTMIVLNELAELKGCGHRLV